MSSSLRTRRVTEVIGSAFVVALMALPTACGPAPEGGETTSGDPSGGSMTTSTDAGSTGSSSGEGSSSTTATGSTSSATRTTGSTASTSTEPVTSSTSMTTSSTTGDPETDSGATTAATTTTQGGDDVPACVFIEARDVGINLTEGLAFSPDDAHLLFKVGLQFERLGRVKLDSEDDPTYYYEGALTNGPLTRGDGDLFFGADLNDTVGVYRQAMNGDGSPQGQPQLVWETDSNVPPPVLSISGNGQWFAFSAFFEDLSFASVQEGIPEKQDVVTYYHVAADDGASVYHVADSDAKDPPYPVGAFDVMSGETTPVVTLPGLNELVVQPGAHQWVWSHYKVDEPEDVNRIFRFNVNTGELEELCDLEHPNMISLSLSNDLAIASDGTTFAVKSVTSTSAYIAALP